MLKVCLFDMKKGEFIYIDNVQDVFTVELNDGYHIGIKINCVYFTENYYYPVKRYELVTIEAR